MKNKKTLYRIIVTVLIAISIVMAGIYFYNYNNDKNIANSIYELRDINLKSDSYNIESQQIIKKIVCDYDTDQHFTMKMVTFKIGKINIEIYDNIAISCEDQNTHECKIIKALHRFKPINSTCTKEPNLCKWKDSNGTSYLGKQLYMFNGESIFKTENYNYKTEVKKLKEEGYKCKEEKTEGDE